MGHSENEDGRHPREEVEREAESVECKARHQPISCSSPDEEQGSDAEKRHELAHEAIESSLKDHAESESERDRESAAKDTKVQGPPEGIVRQVDYDDEEKRDVHSDCQGGDGKT